MNETVEKPAEHLEGREETPLPDLLPQQPASQEALHAEVPGFEKALSEMIEKEVTRRFQSAKDKRWAALEKKYGDLHELSGQAAAPPPEPPAPAETGENFEERISALADLPGLRENEDALAILLRGRKAAGPADYAALVEDLLRLALGGEEAQTGQGAASAASVVIPGGSDTPTDLEQTYQRRKKQLRPGDVNALTALKREFRQKGLDVF